MNRTSLCIQMLMLLKARGLMNTKDLARELETKERNIREFKKELIVAGYNICEKKGRYGGYYLDEQTLFPSLNLSSKEQEALQEAREVIQSSNALQFNKDFDRALDKVLNTVKDTQQSQLVYLNSMPVSISAKESEMITEAREALAQSKCIQLEYTSKGKTQSETFLVDPYEIIHYRNAYYILGFAHHRNDYRMYRFSESRMSQCSKTEQGFLRDSYFHIEQHIGKNSLIKGKFQRVEVKVDPDMISIFKEVNWGMDFQEKEPGVFSFLVEDLHLFFQHVYTFHSKMEIIEPQSVRQDYIVTLEKTLQQYKK